ncbi:MAG: excinuclease ABC subunit UvrB [bacterium]|nr:excinuclease ABC subunit UvrB [bacterium]
MAFGQAKFFLETEFVPRGDQPLAISKLVEGVRSDKRFQVLLGVTGSGKSFTMACVIKELGMPAVIIEPNKTLAGQIYTEFKSFFPKNAVEYLVSYYDYYQPESYLPEYDMYIEKEAIVNEEIDRLRHSTTRSVISRKDVVVIATVSAIYNIGSPHYYGSLKLNFRKKQKISLFEFFRKLVASGYVRSDLEFKRGTFRVRGDTVDVFPVYEESYAIRFEFFGDEIETIKTIDAFTGKPVYEIEEAEIFPGNHYIAPKNEFERALSNIRKELKEVYEKFLAEDKKEIANRIKRRVEHDLEMLENFGFCKGIENYSRHFDGRQPGEPPYTIFDYFSDDFLLFIDESHITVPQLHGMYKGDFTRKKNLVDYGWRLPSAYDNRPLKFEEFKKFMKYVIFVSATPGDWELSVSEQVVEQIVRPTGIVDPPVFVKPAKDQIQDVVKEVQDTVSRGFRAFVLTLTKKQAEELSEYLNSLGMKARYLHSEIDTIERMDILRDLRLGVFDVLVGINLLREGLDVPEVALVAILDADRQGFLRSARSIIQISGRAARNTESKVILYADLITEAIQKAVEEMQRRRRIQMEYNEKNGITPQTIRKEIRQFVLSKKTQQEDYDWTEFPITDIPPSKISEVIKDLEKKMKEYAKNLEFENAAKVRDKIRELKKIMLQL